MELISMSKKTGTKQKSLMKKQESPPRLGIMQSIKGVFTNLSFKTQGFKKLPYFWPKQRKQSRTKSTSKQQKIYLFGVKLNQQECMKLHANIIWFTYRKHIRFQNNDSLHSDIGWGCLIRVAQMALARAIQKYFLTLNKKVDLSYIITPFLEEQGPEFKYSINRFIAQSEMSWGIKAGQWFSMSQIGNILQRVHQNNPLKGTQHLKVKYYYENICVKELLSYFGAVQCSCIQKRVVCSKCNVSASVQSYGTSISNPETYSKQILLIVTAQIGSGHIDKTKYNILLSLMQMQIFSGCLGGINKEARFITGKNGDKLSYLDPHYVLDAVNRTTLCKQIQTFRCNQYRLMSMQEMSLSVGLCFYLRSVHDLAQLTDFIDKMIQQHKQQTFLGYEQQFSGEFQVIEETQVPHQMKAHFQDLQMSFSDLNASRLSQQSSFFFD